MGSKKKPINIWNSSPVASEERDVADICAMQLEELENLTLVTQPFKTFKLFIFAVIQYLQRSAAYLLAHGSWFLLLSTIIVLPGVLLVKLDGPHEKHIEEVLEYVRFGLWWMALGLHLQLASDLVCIHLFCISALILHSSQ